ncbi:MAG: transposase, partial [Flavobacteriales bacterium]|nr:transposase [Flavobacteriales bacterium]
MSGHGQAHIIEEIKDRDIKLIDSTTISLCLSMFDWAKFWTAKGGIKIHTCWDDALMIPDMVNITEAKVHDSKGLAQSVFRKGTVIVEDRPYFDFSLMLQRIVAENVFVTRIKTNTVFDTVEELELPEDSDQDILKDEIIILLGDKVLETSMAQHY